MSTAQVEKAITYLISSSVPNPTLPRRYDSVILNSAFKQPRIPEIIKNWRKLFQQKNLTPQQAHTFLQQIFSALEALDGYIDYNCTGSETYNKADHWCDFTVYRPGKKKGWGLHLTLSGEGYYNCLRQRFITKKGDLILLSPDAFYDFKRHQQCDHWHSSWLCFQLENQLANFVSWPEIGPGIRHLPINDEATMERIQSLFTDIHTHCQNNSTLVRQLRYNLLEQIFILCQLSRPESQCKEQDHRIERTLEYIEHNFTQDMTIEQLANHANTSVATLSRLFKKHLGLSPLNWRDEKRMQLACEKLTQSCLRISQIAELCGYEDQLYFSRVFRKNLGTSPSHYRKQFSIMSPS